MWTLACVCILPSEGLGTGRPVEIGHPVRGLLSPCLPCFQACALSYLCPHSSFSLYPTEILFMLLPQVFFTFVYCLLYIHDLGYFLSFPKGKGHKEWLTQGLLISNQAELEYWSFPSWEPVLFPLFCTYLPAWDFRMLLLICYPIGQILLLCFV